MSENDYEPLPLGDYRYDTSKDKLPLLYSERMKQWSPIVLRRTVFILLLLLIVAVAALISTVIIFYQPGIKSAPGDGLKLNSMDRISLLFRILTNITIVPTELRMIAATPADQLEDVWNNIVPENRGFVWIDNPEKYGFPPGLSQGHDERKVYGVSWAHQLHCLRTIRNKYHHLQSSQSQNFLGLEDEASPDPSVSMDLHHIEHCFDYLRQNIECISDMAIEWADPFPNKLIEHQYHINGYGVFHQCRRKVSYKKTGLIIRN